MSVGLIIRLSGVRVPVGPPFFFIFHRVAFGATDYAFLESVGRIELGAICGRQVLSNLSPHRSASYRPKGSR